MQEIIDSIHKPMLILDVDRAKRNIRRMVEKSRHSGVRLRPHFKTHQSALIGEWFREQGVNSITVSSVDMAEYFVDHGWQDITIAFPANVRQIGKLNSLIGRASIGLLVESMDVVRRMDKELIAPVSAWLKIDSGYHRTGLSWSDRSAVRQVARSVLDAGNLGLAGLLTHAGQTYGLSSPPDIIATYWDVLSRMNEARRYLDDLVPSLAISVGDTPGCSLVDAFGDVDEVRPGNFVFYDLAQFSFGSCRQEDIAVALACPIVAKHPERNELILYGGAIHLSKESIPGPGGTTSFGQVALPESNGWSEVIERAFVTSLSQEHGVVKMYGELFDQLNVGDILMVLPVHSCLTANLNGRYLTLEGQVIEMARFV